jgi:hypothetical protein
VTARATDNTMNVEPTCIGLLAGLFILPKALQRFDEAKSDQPGKPIEELCFREMWRA